MYGVLEDCSVIYGVGQFFIIGTTLGGCSEERHGYSFFLYYFFLYLYTRLKKINTKTREERNLGLGLEKNMMPRL